MRDLDYLFSDNDVLDLIVRTKGVLGISDCSSLEELLWKFINFEPDFTVDIPKKLQQKIDSYEIEYFEDNGSNESDGESFESETLYFDEARHWAQTGIQDGCFDTDSFDAIEDEIERLACIEEDDFDYDE